MKTIIIASNNAHKAEEIKNILSLDGCRFLTLREAGINVDPDESANTYLGNARIKAQAVALAIEEMDHEERNGLRNCCGKGELNSADTNDVRRDIYVLADDSGLEVDALNGAPGVHSARYAGTNTSDADNNVKLLSALVGVTECERDARFVCQLVLLNAGKPYCDSSEIIARGVFEGRIAFCEQGENGFGYDPLFLPEFCEYEKRAQHVKCSVLLKSF